MYVCASVCVCVCARICMYIYSYIHICCIYIYVYIYIHMYVYICFICVGRLIREVTCRSISRPVQSEFDSIQFDLTIVNPPATLNHVKYFGARPPRDAHSKLVQLWYKSFQRDHRGQVEMRKPTRLSNKISIA